MPSFDCAGAVPALDTYYAQHGALRGLPWRAPDCPFDLQVLVEGLLARTRAEAVAAAFETVFAGVHDAPGWLALPVAERTARCGALGLPQQKAGLVTQLAEALTGARRLDPARYVHGMALLRLGAPAAPVDTHVARIADRCGAPDAGAWVGALVGAAGLGGDPPRAYRVVSALLDVGAGVCRPRGAVDHEACPLDRWCTTAATGKVRTWPVLQCARCGAPAESRTYGARGLCSGCYWWVRRHGHAERYGAVERRARAGANLALRVVRTIGATTAAAVTGLARADLLAWAQGTGAPEEHRAALRAVLAGVQRVARARRDGEPRQLDL